MRVAKGRGELVPVFGALWIPPVVLALVVIDVVDASWPAFGRGPQDIVPVIHKQAFDIVVSRLERIHLAIEEFVLLLVRHELQEGVCLREVGLPVLGSRALDFPAELDP